MITHVPLDFLRTSSMLVANGGTVRASLREEILSIMRASLSTALTSARGAASARLTWRSHLHSLLPILSKLRSKAGCLAEWAWLVSWTRPPNGPDSTRCSDFLITRATQLEVRAFEN